MAISLYGAKWDIPELQVHLGMYSRPELRKHISDSWLEQAKLTRKDLKGPSADWMFGRAAMRCAYGNKRRWVWHLGMDQLGEAWCKHRRLCVVGPTRVTKSYFFGAWAPLDWLAMAEDTNSFLYSTSLIAIRKRVWKSVAEHWSFLEREHPWVKDYGRIIQAPSLGVHCKKPGAESGIFCLAIDASIQSEEDLNSKIGQHNLRVRVYGDEVQGLNPVALQLETNLGGSKYYKEAVWGNFGGEHNALGVAARPPSRVEDCPDGWTKGDYEGWREYALRTNELDLTRQPVPEEWDAPNPNKPGKPWFHVLWLDGLRTPSVLHPDGPEAGDKLFGEFMLGWERIQEIPDTGHSWWKMVRSAPMPVSEQEVCLSEQQRNQCQVEAPALWLNPAWAYSYGIDGGRLGDPTALTAIRSGTAKSGKQQIEFLWSEEFEPHKEETDIDMAIVKWIMARLAGVGADKSLVAVEGARTSNLSSLWDTLERTWKVPGKLLRVSTQHKGFPEKDLYVNEANKTLVREAYAHMSAFLWLMPREFARAGMLRGLSDSEIKEELEARKVYPESDPVEIQAKEIKGKPGPGKFAEFKKELGRSPNKTDSFVMALLHQRIVHNVHPGPPIAAALVRSDSEGDGKPERSARDRWRLKASKLNAGRSTMKLRRIAPRIHHSIFFNDANFPH
jgi:hypothetical protein